MKTSTIILVVALVAVGAFALYESNQVQQDSGINGIVKDVGGLFGGGSSSGGLGALLTF